MLGQPTLVVRSGKVGEKPEVLGQNKAPSRQHDHCTAVNRH